MAKPPIPAAERAEPRQALWTSLLVLAACLPLTQHLQWQVNAFLALIFAVRLAGLRWPAAIPGAGVRVLLTFAGVANCLHGYHTLAGQDGGAALLTTMLSLKLLELEAKRDLRLVIILIGFLIVVQFLFDDSFASAVYLGLVTLGAVALLAHLNGGLENRGPRSAWRLATRLALQAIPLTLVLFFLFPRLEAPLWSMGIKRDALTGMSDTMEPGAISKLVVDGEGAFRVRFDSAPPASDQLYWRGPVLWDMDGRRWTPGPPTHEGEGAARLIEAASTIDYEVVMEATHQRWLFALDMPAAAPDDAFLTSALQVISRRPVNSLKRYRIRSALRYRTQEPSPALRERALQLPDNISPRMRALAADWRAEAGSDWQVVQRGLAFFNRENFHYTLDPPLLGRNPADEFLFETRSGFCEHYSSAFALLMRVAGIPTRIVLGYLGGEDNDIGGYKIVRQSDAHAWVEVMIAGRGWVRVDPTAAVDPSRIDRSSAERLLGAGGSVRFSVDDLGELAHFVRNLRLLVDTLDATWQDWVLGFSSEDQLAMLNRLGLGSLREYGLAALMLLAISVTLGVVMLGLMRDKPDRDPLDALYAAFCRKLAQSGLPRHHYEGPRDYGERILHERPDLRAPVSRFLALYIPARYGADDPCRDLATLTAQLRAFQPRRQPRAQAPPRRG